MNTKKWIALGLALIALGFAGWGVVLLILMVAHAVSTFLSAVGLFVAASVIGWIAMFLMGQDLFKLLTDRIK